MKLLMAFLLSTMLLNTKSCDPKHTDEIPTCIQQMISEYANRPVQNPSGEFYSYDYKGQKVFFFKPPCCDQMSKLYDSACNLIAQPDGGIKGTGDGRCQDFFTTRTNEKLLWHDDRQ